MTVFSRCQCLTNFTLKFPILMNTVRRGFRCCSFNYDEPVPIHSHILHSVHIMWHCHYISHFSTVAILLLGSACVLLIDPVRGFLEDSEYGEGVEGDAVKDEEDSEGDDDKEDDEQEELKPSAASMSSQYVHGGYQGYKAEMCIDGKDEGAEKGKANTMCHTKNGKKSDPFPWLAIDYGKDAKVSVEKVIIANRVKCCGERTMNVEVRLTNELPTDGKSKLTSGQLVGTFEGPGENGQKIELEAEDGWEGTVGRYLIVQMDHSDKTDKKAQHGINLMEVTGFGQTYRTNCEK